jgi:hypothetical protein
MQAKKRKPMLADIEGEIAAWIKENMPIKRW